MLKKLYSVFFGKCPRCHQGDFFVTKNPFNFSQFDKIHPRCSACDEDFFPEPGFYFGAMYVSYALTVALTVISFVGFVVLLDIQIEVVLGILITLLLVLLPVFYRTARIIWLNFFVNFDPRFKAYALEKKQTNSKEPNA